MTGTKDEKGETLTVNSVGPIAAGTDIIAMLAPLGINETTPPEYQLLADGVVKVTTAEGTDYVFLSSKPIRLSV